MNLKHCLFLLLLIPAIALMGCEGDAGPQGEQGIQGIQGPEGPQGPAGPSATASCIECHNADQMLLLQMQYAASGHAGGENVEYAGGRVGCANCHSKQGFILFALGQPATQAFAGPEAIDCQTCHAIHDTYQPDDYALRLSGPVTLLADLTHTHQLDMGNNSNLCVNCHQARVPEPNVATPGETYRISNTHYGPHHGPQANIFGAYGFAEIAGAIAYPTTNLHHNASCTTCHMGTYTAQQGGHSWNASLAACTACHGEQTSFDVNGYQTQIQTKLDALRDRLVDLGVVAFDETEGYHPVVGTYPMLQAQAYYNWIGVTEDRSIGVHNPRYINALLTNTLAALPNPVK